MRATIWTKQMDILSLSQNNSLLGAIWVVEILSEQNGVDLGGATWDNIDEKHISQWWYVLKLF